MGKKTKKEKIIADLRRKVLLSQSQTFLSHSTQTPSSKEISQNKSPVISQSEKPISTLDQKVSLYIYPVHLIKKDLTKTLLLSILAISFEIGLYFVLEKNVFPLPGFLKFLR